MFKRSLDSITVSNENILDMQRESGISSQENRILYDFSNIFDSFEIEKKSSYMRRLEQMGCDFLWTSFSYPSELTLTSDNFKYFGNLSTVGYFHLSAPQSLTL